MADKAMEPGFGLPAESLVREMFSTVADTHRGRNEVIRQFREALDNKNPIKAPESVQFKVVVQHSGALRAILEEKESRYRRIPQILIAPDGGGKREQAQADKLGLKTNRLLENIDARGASAWSRMLWDGNAFDGAVERIECAPNAYWPDLVVVDGKDKLMHAFQSDKDYQAAKERYKRQAGPPIRRVYVPLENFYPIVEGDTFQECFSIEERTLRSCKGNKLFDQTKLASFSEGRDGGLRQKVVILHYNNQEKHAYYVLGPAPTDRSGRIPSFGQMDSLIGGMPSLLYAYDTKIGRPIYNLLRARGTAWLDGDNPQIAGAMQVLLDLNRDQDEMWSQIATYMRNLLWPTRVMKYSPENRGTDGGLPTPKNIPEGGTIPIWADEAIENIVAPLQQFELAEWAYNARRQQMSDLAGSGVIFGERQPGVTSGYQQQAQISRAEGLDSLAEQNFAFGAAEGVRIIYGHIRALEEPIPVHVPLFGAKEGALGGKWMSISPDELEPPPNVYAKVRDPRPIDALTSVQAALQATQIRPGHNTPLLSTERALTEYMGITDTTAEEQRKTAEMFREKLLQSDVLVQVLTQRLGFALAQRQSSGQLTAQDAAMASPAMQEAAAMAIESGATMGQGGVSAATQDAMMQGREMSGTPTPEAPTSGTGGALQGVGGGVPAGNAQPAQTAARAAQLLQQVTGP